MKFVMLESSPDGEPVAVSETILVTTHSDQSVWIYQGTGRPWCVKGTVAEVVGKLKGSDTEGYYHKAWGELAAAVGPLKADRDRYRAALVEARYKIGTSAIFEDYKKMAESAAAVIDAALGEGKA